jgi:hypothetical protein
MYVEDVNRGIEMKLTIAALTVIAFGQIVSAQTVPAPAQGQHLTRTHRTRVVTGKPLFAVPKENTTPIITYTPEDIRELVVQNHNTVEKVTLQQINLVQ